MYQLDDLLHLMARLRDPQHGCPWDLKQSYASIVPYTLEEAYEVADAIERSDFAHLPGELGDLLFQVVYYSQLAREDGRFEFAQVVDGITRKLVRRHPHVFPDGELYGAPDMAKLGDETLSPRARVILLYGLCGFASLPSLGIMIGGLGAMVPERRKEIVALGFKSVIAATLATAMTGAVVGLFV